MYGGQFLANQFRGLLTAACLCAVPGAAASREQDIVQEHAGRYTAGSSDQDGLPD